MTRYLIGLFLGALVLALVSTVSAQTTTTSTSSSTSSTTSTSTSTTSTSNTVPCVANGLPCALDANCCSGICNDFNLCEAASTTSTSLASTTSTSSTTTTSTSNTSSTTSTSTSTTTTTSSSTTTTLIVYDNDGTLLPAVQATGNSLKWIRFEPNRPEAITFHTVIAAGTGTVKIQQSLDGGVTWNQIGSDISASGLVTFEHPTGLFRANVSACTGCTITQWWSMQRNP